MQRILFGPRNRVAHRRTYLTELTGDGGSDGVMPISTWTFTRSGGASYYDDNGIIQQKGTNEIRSPVKIPQKQNGLVDGAIFEEAGTNRVTYSDDLSGADWTDVGGNTYTAVGVTPLFASGASQKFTNAGSAADKGAQQTVTTFTASWESGAAIVENVDASEFTIGVYNTVAGSYAALVTLDFGTEGVTGGTTGSGSSQAYRVEDLGTGPNGGQMYRVFWRYYNGGSTNGRRVDVFPTGRSTNTDSAIVHHVHLEQAKATGSPIRTTTSVATRNVEFTEGAYTEAFQEMTVFLRYQFVDGGMTNGDRFWQIGQGNTTGDPRFWLQIYTGLYERAYYDNGTATVDTGIIAASATDGDIVDVRVVMFSDGSVQIHRTINGGSEVSGTQSSAPSGGIVGSPTTISIGFNGDSGNRMPILPIYGMAIFAGEQDYSTCLTGMGLPVIS